MKSQTSSMEAQDLTKEKNEDLQLDKNKPQALEQKEDSEYEEDSEDEEAILEKNFKLIKHAIEKDDTEGLKTILQSTGSKNFADLINYSSQGKLTIIKYLIDNNKIEILEIILQEAQACGKFSEVINLYDKKNLPLYNTQ